MRSSFFSFEEQKTSFSSEEKEFSFSSSTFEEKEVFCSSRVPAPFLSFHPAAITHDKTNYLGRTTNPAGAKQTSGEQ